MTRCDSPLLSSVIFFLQTVIDETDYTSDEEPGSPENDIPSQLLEGLEINFYQSNTHSKIAKRDIFLTITCSIWINLALCMDPCFSASV